MWQLAFISCLRVRARVNTVQKNNLFWDLCETGSYFMKKIFPGFPLNDLQLLCLGSLWFMEFYNVQTKSSISHRSLSPGAKNVKKTILDLYSLSSFWTLKSPDNIQCAVLMEFSKLGSELLEHYAATWLISGPGLTNQLARLNLTFIATGI